METSSFLDQICKLRDFLLTRAFRLLGVFSLAALWVIPTLGHLPTSSPHFRPACILFVIGSVLWLSTIAACIHVRSQPDLRPSFLASLVFFLFLGLELLALEEAVRIF